MVGEILHQYAPAAKRKTPGIPEPTTTALFALGLLGVGFARKRRTH
jgi:hypothetical protein